MIWTSVHNCLPEVHTKCEVLMPRENGDLEVIDADYDIFMKMFLLSTSLQEKDGVYTHVSHWRPL